ncbi:VOC family protein [uncultured Jannaschia sp.]|uniref:VOC family protein n=1 Tax=uncultured Jannaschia sp. TaxID=293347 RepID=UPI00260CA29C|nr:VOC family protein [uncultured Jannaschia sp.]
MMRLGAVALIVPDYDPAIAFFTAIGFALTADEDQGRKRWVTMRAGDVEIVLARADGARQVAAIGDQFAGRVGLFLRTADFALDAARIEAAGGSFEEAPRRESYGTVAVWRDPWGNRWDLIQPK